MNTKLFTTPAHANEYKTDRDAKTLEKALNLLLESEKNKLATEDKAGFIQYERTDLTIVDYFSPANLSKVKASTVGRHLAVFEQMGIILKFTPAEFFQNFYNLVEGEYLHACQALGSDLEYKFLTYNFQTKFPFVVFHNGEKI